MLGLGPPVLEFQMCHLIHLTILRRFSIPSLTYMCTKMAYNPIDSFHSFISGRLQKQNPGIAVSVKSQQASRRILNTLRDKVIELRGEGVLDIMESHKLELVSLSLFLILL